MSKFNLIVAEGHWSDHSNHSVKALFDLLSDLLRHNSHAYKYTQFSDPAAFDSCVKQLANSTHKYLYIGSHGSAKGIYGSHSATPLSYTKIKNRIPDMKGLYLGTCLFGEPNTLRSFVKETKLVWCAGYRKSVDWVDSSALDLAFWKIFQIYNTKQGKKVEKSLIESTIKEMKSKYASLILDLGFNIALWRTDEDGKPFVDLAF